jgi:hypothetical protein
VAKKPKRSTQTRTADKLFSELVRSKGFCEAKSYKAIKCAGPLQCCHLLSRRYKKIRYDFRNAICMCSSHHVFFTHAPDEWFVWLAEIYPGRVRELREELQTPWDRDLDTPLARLKGLHDESVSARDH